MVKECIHKNEGKLYPLSNKESVNTIQTYEKRSDVSMMSNNSYLSDNPEEAKVLIGMTLSFFTGILHVRLKM